MSKKPTGDPITLRIGAVDYKIQCVERLTDEGAQRFYGLHHLTTSLIEIDAEQGPQNAWNTLWHETLHAVCDAAGIEKHPDENIIRALSEGICGALRDNPDLLTQPLTEVKWEYLKKSNKSR